MRGERFFRRFFDLVGASPALRRMILEELGRPERRWHGLLHHALMLRAVARPGTAPAERRLLVLATLFHDIVYDATRNDNEEASAEVMRRWVDAADAPRVAALILATKRHDLDTDPVTRRLLEADLAVLWTPNAALYRFYADGIRAEYGHVPDAAYRRGRAAVLDALQERIAPMLDARRRAALAANLDAERGRLSTDRSA